MLLGEKPTKLKKKTLALQITVSLRGSWGGFGAQAARIRGAEHSAKPCSHQDPPPFLQGQEGKTPRLFFNYGS